MDLGQFARSRWVLGLWLGIPATLIVAAILPSMLYRDGIQHALAERKAILQAVIPMENSMVDIEAALTAALGEPAHGTRMTDSATRRINQAAQSAGFSVRALTVDKSTGDADGLRAVRISVQGQGSLSAVIRWLDALQEPDLLLRVETASVTAILPSEGSVNGDFTLVLFVRSS